MELFILYNIILLNYAMVIWLRLSCRQIIFFWGYVILSSTFYGIIFNFYQGIILLICGATVSIIALLVLFILFLHKIDAKFDQPLYEKGALKVIFKIIRYTYKTKDKNNDDFLGRAEALNNKEGKFYKFRKNNNFIFIVSELGYTIINIESGKLLHKKNLTELPEEYVNIFIEYESFKELYFLDE